MPVACVFYVVLVRSMYLFLAQSDYVNSPFDCIFALFSLLIDTATLTV